MTLAVILLAILALAALGVVLRLKRGPVCVRIVRVSTFNGILPEPVAAEGWAIVDDSGRLFIGHPDYSVVESSQDPATAELVRGRDQLWLTPVPVPQNLAGIEAHLRSHFRDAEVLAVGTICLE